jgi:caspase domain-containing protein
MGLGDVSPRTTLAILLGASAWPYSPQLASSPAFARSAKDFRDYLISDDGFGLPPENLLDLFDREEAPTQLDAQIQQFLDRRTAELQKGGAGPTDLILYYVGHGGFTGRGHDYYLAVRSTRKDSEGISSLRMADLADTLQKRARRIRRYVILDSCFAASAYAEFQSAPLAAAREKIIEAFPGKGTALLCSSGARDPSLAPVNESHTMFSGTLLEVLRRGDPQGRDSFSLEDIGERVKELVVERYPDEHVRPEVHSPDQREGDIANIPLFPNLALRTARLAELVTGFGRRLDQVERSVPADLRARVDRIEMVLGEAKTAIEAARMIGQRVSALEDGFSKTREQPIDGSHPDKNMSSRGESREEFFGLRQEMWEEIPPPVRRSLLQWRQARLLGKVWFIVAVIVCALGFTFAFGYVEHLLRTTYALIVVLAVASVLVSIRYTLGLARIDLVGNESPEVAGFWERLDPVVKMRAAGQVRVFGSVSLASPWPEISTLLYVMTTLVLSVWTGVWRAFL